MYNRINIIKLLLIYNIDINHRDYYGCTGFIYACRRNYLELIYLLLDKKVNILLKDDD